MIVFMSASGNSPSASSIHCANLSFTTLPSLFRHMHKGDHCTRSASPDS